MIKLFLLVSLVNMDSPAEDKRKEAEYTRSTSKQVALALLTNFSSIAPSMSLGFSAVALPVFEGTLNDSQMSWFASVASLATPFGCFFSGPIADRFGRKTALFFVNIACLLGWIAIAAACFVKGIHYPLLILGRIFTGFSTGLSSSPASIYMAEVSTPQLRGVFTVWPSIFFSIGVLVVYFLGYLLKDGLVLLSLLTSILPCIGIALTIFLIPESPSWFVGKNRLEDAKKSMARVLGKDQSDYSVQSEIETLLQSKSSKTENVKTKSLTTQFRRKFQYMLRPYVAKPLLLVWTFFFFQQASGIFVIIFYAIDIVDNAGITIDSYLAIVAIGFVRLIAALIASIVSKRMGKRPLTIFSGASMTVCLIFLVAFIHGKDKGLITSENLNFIPLTFLMVYFLTSSVGFLPLPFALAAELFPTKIKGLAAGLSSGLGYLFSFVLVKVYPDMVKLMSGKGVFLFYGIVSLFGTIFAIFFLPETRGKTIQEIEEYFGKSKEDQKEGTRMNGVC